MGKLRLILILPLLYGCVSLHSDKVSIGGHEITYVFGRSSNFMNAGLVVCDRYDEKGNLLIHDSSSASGLIPSILQGAASSSAGIGLVEGTIGVIK
jgi:hypothetical protein